MNAWKLALAGWCVVACLFAWWLKRRDDRRRFIAHLEAIGRAAIVAGETFEEMARALGDLHGGVARLQHLYVGREGQWVDAGRFRSVEMRVDP